MVPKLGGALCGPKAGRSVVWSQSWEERCVVPKLGGALCGPKLGGALCGPKAGRSIVWSQSWEERCVVPKLGGAWERGYSEVNIVWNPGIPVGCHGNSLFVFRSI